VPNAVALAQGAYFTATGLWPLLHMRSFLAVTGPKTDLWLVKTVGALIAVAGGTIAVAALRDRVTPEVRMLAGGTAAALGAVDVVYTAQRRIPPIYLLDGAIEAAIVAFWGWSETIRRASDGRAV
jgi:hypothetical protein